MGHLRSDAADRWGVPVAWPLAFVHLVAERARMGLRELNTGSGRWQSRAGHSPPGRSTLAAAIEALLRHLALKPNALAAELRIARQRLHC
jgi:hypothetical protein